MTISLSKDLREFVGLVKKLSTGCPPVDEAEVRPAVPEVTA